VSFSRDQARKIREQLGADGPPVACPICGEPLEVEGPIASGGTLSAIVHVTCVPCRHTAVITEAGGTRQLELGV
jgi:hypothetical protein